MTSRPINQVIDQLRNTVLRDSPEPSDEQLLGSFVQSREGAALEALVRRHGPMVWGVCRRVLANHHDAEDAFQATFLVLVRRASSIWPRSKVGNWLYGVAQQTARKGRAAIAKRHTRERQAVDVPEPALASRESANDLASVLDDELVRLPETYRAIVVLCELEGKRIKDVARQFGMPEGTVASRLARGRDMLARRLIRHGMALPATLLADLLALQAATASVPAALVSATVQAASLGAAGQSALAFSVQVTFLADRVVQSMVWSKLGKVAAALLLVLVSCGVVFVYASGLGGSVQVARPEQAANVLREEPNVAPVGGDGKTAEPSPPEATLDARHKRFNDDDLKTLPDGLEVLLLRGPFGYGSNNITDAGIKHLTRYGRLRILAAGGLRLTDQSLESIGTLSALEELSLDSTLITGDGLRHLAGLKKLRRLNLNFTKLTAATLACLPDFPKLTSLQIMVKDLRADDSLLEQLSCYPNLHELRLPEDTAAVTDRGLEFLGELRHLENLYLKGARRVTDAGLGKISHLTALTSLQLHELPGVTPDGLKAIAKLGALRSLEIVEARMTAASMKWLASLTNLEHLLLWSVASEPLPLENLGALRALRTFRTNQPVSSAAIRALSRLPKLESIRDVLSAITDEDLTYLAQTPKLKTLLLGSDKVTAAALPTLAKMTSLRELYMTDKVRITPEQWTRLGESSLPQCRIALHYAPYTVFHKTRE